MSKIQFLLDENMPHGVRDQLIYHQPDIEVLCIGDDDAPPCGTLDPDILDWMGERDFILISRNRNTIPNHLKDHLDKGGQVPGILLLRRKIPMVAGLSF